MSDEIIKTNNDISLFKKIVFVDNIPTENDAKILSTCYPFAIFITKDNYYETEENNGSGLYGRNGVKSDNVDGASSNMWKAGKRLTKFINVDYKRNTVSLDTFSISLHFDPESGLISLIKDTKITSAKIIGLTYINNYNSSEHERLVSTHYLNRALIDKTKFRESSGTIYESLTRNVRNLYLSNSNDTNEMPIFKLINSTSELDNLTPNDINNIDIIDAKYNKFYFVVQYEGVNESALNNVNIDSFKMTLNKNIFNITNYWDLRDLNDDKIQSENIRINNTVGQYNNPSDSIKPLYNDLELMKYYCNIAKSTDRYIVYEAEIKSTIDDIGTSESNINYHDCNFIYDSLSDNGFNNVFQLQFNNIYVNPTTFKLAINNNNRDEYITYNIDSDNNIIIPHYFLYPGQLVNCKLIPYRDVNNNGVIEEITTGIRTDLTLSFSGDNLFTNNMGFKVYENDINSYNENCTSINLSSSAIPDFKFKIQCSETYPEITPENMEHYEQYNAQLIFNIKNNSEFNYKDVFQPLNLDQYKFNDLDVNYNFGGATNFSTQKSGKQMPYCINNIYLNFINPNNGLTWKKQLSLNDDIELKIILNYPGKSVDDNNHTEMKKCFEISDNPANQERLYFKYTGGDNDIIKDNNHSYELGQTIYYYVPWLNPELSVPLNSTERPSINFTCKYNGKYITFCTLYIESDDLESIETNDCLILEQGSVNNLDASFNIVHKTNKIIKFNYKNHQVVDGWKWFYSKDNINHLVNQVNNKYYFNENYVVFGGNINNNEDNISYDSSNINNIQYSLKLDTKIDKVFTLQLKYRNIKSNIISITMQKHSIHWYMYIGCMDYTVNKDNNNIVTSYTINGLTYYNDAERNNVYLTYSDETGGFPTTEEINRINVGNGLGLSDWFGSNPTNDVEIDGWQETVYEGGWIDLGEDMDKFTNNIIISIDSEYPIRTKVRQNNKAMLFIIPHFINITDGLESSISSDWNKPGNIEIENGKYYIFVKTYEPELYGSDGVLLQSVDAFYNFVIDRDKLNNQ